MSLIWVGKQTLPTNYLPSVVDVLVFRSAAHGCLRSDNAADQVA